MGFKIIKLLKNFRGAKNFKKEVLKVMVNMLNEDEIKDMRKEFQKFDV